MRWISPGLRQSAVRICVCVLIAFGTMGVDCSGGEKGLGWRMTLYILLLFVPDPVCVEQGDMVLLAKGTPVQASQSVLRSFLVTGPPSPTKVTIRLFGTGKLVRYYDYCVAGKLKSGSLSRDSPDMECDDGSDDSGTPITGTNAQEVCTLTFPSGGYIITIFREPANPISYEIKYE